jgi:hypothetical protein
MHGFILIAEVVDPGYKYVESKLHYPYCVNAQWGFLFYPRLNFIPFLD